MSGKLSWLLLIILLSTTVEADEKYPLGPDSQPREIPHGKVTRHTWTSTIFPGTTRDYWVYVPAQYLADKPACVMVFQDGGGYANEKGRMRLPVVFDNLIHDRGMPVTIGIFVNPGVLPSAGPNQPGRPNRSFEYDAVSDRYARFLVEEILPEVGKTWNLSRDPNDRAICGGSSGGICAFTAAWFRPDAFRRVLSFVGSFSNLRGGDIYPSLIRKSETRPLRVFLQSGKKDMNTYAGSWYIQNQAMAASFEYMGYDTKVVLGDEGHNDLQGSSILPDALRWLWRDHPKPIVAPRPPGNREWATEIIVPDKGWVALGEGIEKARGLAADRQGNIFVADDSGRRIVRLDARGKSTVFKNLTHACRGMAFGPDGRLYACEYDEGRIVAFAADGRESVVATGKHPLELVVDRHGGVYFTALADLRVWFVDADGSQPVIQGGIEGPSGLGLLPGGSLLAVADGAGRWVWSFQTRLDGSLRNGQPFYRLETTDQHSATGAAGVAVDSDGFIYVATELGIQVCDQEGRTAFIIANPPAGAVTHLVFGGPDLRTLVATAGGKLFTRPVRHKGA
jgi:gluconolactonase